MNKQIVSCILTFALGVFIFTACKKDVSNAPPVIALKGANPYYASLDSAYTDPGAIAHDDNDGDISSLITVSGVSSVNTNQKGSFKITYSVTNAAGLSASVIRNVIVWNNADSLAGSYNVLDSCILSGVTDFLDSISVSSTNNDRLSISNFANTGFSINGTFQHVQDSILFAPNQPLGSSTLLFAYGFFTVDSTGLGKNLNIIYSTTDGTTTDTCKALFHK